MILLDTHIWVWLADGGENLREAHHEAIAVHRSDGLCVSAISCWEVAKLVEYGRLELTINISTWMQAALHLPGIRRVELTPRVAIASTQLPGEFHKDPADQMIVATARLHEMALLTEDRKIRAYEHVRVI